MPANATATKPGATPGADSVSAATTTDTVTPVAHPSPQSGTTDDAGASTSSTAARRPTREQIRDWVRATETPPPPPVTPKAQTAEPDPASPADSASQAADPQTPTDQTPAPQDTATPPADTPADPDPAPAKNPWPKDALERVRKLKDQRNRARDDAQTKDRTIAELNQRLQALEARAADGPSNDAAPDPLAGPAAVASGRPPGDPVETMSDPASIEARASQARDLAQWAQDRIEAIADEPDAVAQDLQAAGIKPPADGWDPKTLRDALRGIRDKARHVADKAAPARLHFVTRERDVIERVSALVPELADDASPLAREVAATVQRFPWLRQMPEWAYLATAGVLGEQVLAERAARNSRPPAAEPTPAPPKPVTPPKAAPRVPGVGRSSAPSQPPNDIEAARARLRDAGKGASQQDRIAFIKASLLAGVPG